MEANLNWIKVRARLYAFSCKPPYFIGLLLCRSFDFVGHVWLNGGDMLDSSPLVYTLVESEACLANIHTCSYFPRARFRVVVRCDATSQLRRHTRDCPMNFTCTSIASVVK